MRGRAALLLALCAGCAAPGCGAASGAETDPYTACVESCALQWRCSTARPDCAAACSSAVALDRCHGELLDWWTCNGAGDWRCEDGVPRGPDCAAEGQEVLECLAIE